MKLTAGDEWEPCAACQGQEMGTLCSCVADYSVVMNGREQCVASHC